MLYCYYVKQSTIEVILKKELVKLFKRYQGQECLSCISLEDAINNWLINMYTTVPTFSVISICCSTDLVIVRYTDILDEDETITLLKSIDEGIQELIPFPNI